MAVERFDNKAGVLFRKTATVESDVEQLYRRQPIFLEHTTAAGVNTIRHGLGRVPMGLRVVNMEVPAATGDDCRWYREAGDDAWTDAVLSVRFTVSGARLLLEVF